MAASNSVLRGVIHCHSKYSYDSATSINRYVRFAREHRLDFLILTDHNTIEGSRALHAAAAKHYPQLQVPIAAEYLTEFGDVIAVFLHSEIKAMTFAGFVSEARKQNALLLFPHPFVGHRNIETVGAECDLIEVFNSRVAADKNLAASELAGRLRKPAYAGCDAHLALSLGRVIVTVENHGDLRTSLLVGGMQWTSLCTPKWEVSASQMIKAVKKRDLRLAGSIVKAAARRALAKAL